MRSRRLVYLGSNDPAAPLSCEGRELSPGEAVELRHRRSPWRAGQEIERVIIGSHRSRADVLLEGSGIRPEHVRVYLPASDGPVDFRPLHEGAASLAGRPIEALEWTPLAGGEEIELGPYRFRYEVTVVGGSQLA